MANWSIWRTPRSGVVPSGPKSAARLQADLMTQLRTRNIRLPNHNAHSVRALVLSPCVRSNEDRVRQAGERAVEGKGMGSTMVWVLLLLSGPLNVVWAMSVRMATAGCRGPSCPPSCSSPSFAHLAKRFRYCRSARPRRSGRGLAP